MTHWQINPVVGREFFGILRSPRAFLTLFALTIAFSVTVILHWPSDATVDLSGSQSIRVFRIFGYGLMAAILFLVPAFPATSIVNEKSAGTLALLLNSPLRPISIYLGKLAGVLMFAMLVLLGSLPGAAACYAMGGIDLAGGLGLLYLVLVLLIIQYATLGMLVSSYSHSADSGVRVTYCIVLGLFFLSLVPAAFFSEGSGPLGEAARWIRFASPIPVVMSLMGQHELTSKGLVTPSPVVPFLFITAISSLLFAVATLSRLNYRIFDRSRSQGRITDDQKLGARIIRRFLFVVDPQRRKHGIPWFLNPVMVKEFRSRRFGRTQWLFRLIAACALISLALTFAAAVSVTLWGVETIGGLMVMLQVILIIVMTPSLTAGLISGERDSGGWALMRLTSLSAFQIVVGKLLSVLWTLFLVLLATLPGYLVMIFIAPQMWYQIQWALACLLATVIYTLAISAAVGSLFRHTAVSTAVTYVSVVTLFVFPLLIWLGRDAPFGHDTVRYALLINPAGAAMEVIGTSGFESYQLLPASWWVASCVASFMFVLFGWNVWRLTRPL